MDDKSKSIGVYREVFGFDENRSISVGAPMSGTESRLRSSRPYEHVFGHLNTFLFKFEHSFDRCASPRLIQQIILFKPKVVQ